MTITTTNEQTSEQTERPNAVLLQLDPRVLIAHPNNPRKKLTGIKELAQSVKLVGVVQPLVVTSDGDGYRIIAGHRRAAAAIEAGCDIVPCVLDASWGESELAPLTAFVAENVNRAGLSTAEEAETYRQMQLLGMPVGDIAKASGRKRNEVSQAIIVAESAVALALTARHDLTLDQAAAIAEFAEEREALKELTVLAVRSPGSFDHRVSRLRQDRAREAQYQELLADFTERNIRVVERPEQGDKIVVPVRDLSDKKGKALDAKKHEDCLGYAVAIEADWSGELHITDYCTRWKENGHLLKTRTVLLAASGSDATEAKAKRREIIENNKAWRAAEPVRRQFVTDLCARKSVPKGLLRYAVSEAVGSPADLARVKDDIFTELAGLDTTKSNPRGPTIGHQLAGQVSDSRLPLVLFAHVAASVESAMGVHTWRNLRSATREQAYLTFLAALGYTLSDIEQLVADGDEDKNVKAKKAHAVKVTSIVDPEGAGEVPPEGPDGEETDPDEVA